ncbi:two component transcriptional regulator, winged helix family [Halothece sp. PCC 7418]|uniref:response regulator transcription factor n=1 Tax=Halothece sp. (strain PCC 7418) TaxID=65093 RepID=UPI0002A08B3C|nr:response regulator transcription factor [Halothece sp. PCC 7418]AFZ44998.1 two component transcriptional regulator, winged helix family [Halothece sp. PCC 7418]
MKILLVSSNQILQKKLHQKLSHHHFVVELAIDGEEAWDLLQAFLYDLVLLDSVLPKVKGIELCRRLREVGNPVLILLLLAVAGWEHCIEGLNSGADACLSHPFPEAALFAQIEALGRRGKHRASFCLDWGPVSLNPTTREVTCKSQRLKLNRKEYQLLKLFLSHPRQRFPCHEIGDRLWTLDEQLPTNATIKSHIRSIRRKLEQAGMQDLIQTRYGQGYSLNSDYDPETKPSNKGNATPEPMMDAVTANLWQELMAANARLQREVEERRAVESELRCSERMLRNAQKAAQIGCWEWNLENRKLYWTEELFLLHGLDPTQPPPHPDHPEEALALIHPDDVEHYQQNIRIPAIKGEAFEANLRIIRANDGEIRYINARGGPVFDHLGKIIKLTGTTFDITKWVVNSK